MSNKGFVFLDFQKKTVYFAESKRNGWDEPATTAEWEAFVTHFQSKGKNNCTFSELKQHVNFHGTRKKGRVYATVNITDKFVYMRLLEKDKDLQRAMSAYIWQAVERRREINAEVVAKDIMEAMIKTLQKKLKMM